MVFHRGILTYRSAATVKNRGVCFLLLNYGGQKTISVRSHTAANISENKYGENGNPYGWIIWNPENWNPESKGLKSGLQMFGIRNPIPPWILFEPGLGSG